VPPAVVLRLLKGRVPTKAQLSHIGIKLTNILCEVCFLEVKNVSHLILGCKKVSIV